MNKGGSKPVFKGAPSACLTAFGAMASQPVMPANARSSETPLHHALCQLQVQDKRKELLTAKMHDYYKAEPKALHADAKAIALKEWKLLDDEHRSVYQERAAGTAASCLKMHTLRVAPAGLQRKYVP